MRYLCRHGTVLAIGVSRILNAYLVQVRFERGTVATPELLQDIELPTSISVLGQPVDLTNLKVCPHPHSPPCFLFQFAMTISQLGCSSIVEPPAPVI